MEPAEEPTARLGFWRRTAQRAQEADLLGAVERVLLGRANEHDALAARAAWLDYLRGRRFEDARIELLLARLQLETSFRADRRLEERLAESLERPAPPDLLGQAFIDFGNLAALRGDAVAAEARFERALGLLWEETPRARALLGRGWAALARGDARRASGDFEAASRLGENLRLVVAALWSGALALERSGRPLDAERWVERAGELERVRAKASGRDAFDGVARVPAYERYAIESLRERFALERAQRSQDLDEMDRAQKARCDALRAYLEQAAPAGAAGVEWARASVAEGCPQDRAPAERSPGPTPPDSRERP